MAFTPERNIDQGYTYQQLRDEISDKIAMADTLGLVSLINAENIEVVRFCDDRKLPTDETQTNTKSVAQLYSDYEQLKTDIAAAASIDDVLILFSSTNANLANLSDDFEDIILTDGAYSVADPTAYIDNLDDVAFAKESITCL